MIPPFPTLLVLRGRFAARASYGAQCIESVPIVLCHILDTVLTLNLFCVCVQGVRFQKIGPSILPPKHDRL